MLKDYAVLEVGFMWRTVGGSEWITTIHRNSMVRTYCKKHDTLWLQVVEASVSKRLRNFYSIF